jgi:hypothetical protein
VIVLTLASVQRDFVEWRRGRRYFAVWAIGLEFPPVRAACAAAAAALGPLLRSDYRRLPHLTLGVCGFAVAQPTLHDDFGPEALAAQTQALLDARVASFEIDIGPADSFTSAAYLQVRDLDGGIAALRRALVRATPRIDVAPPPHVTFGLYAQAVPLDDVHTRLRRHAIAPLRLRVAQLACMVYEAADIGGPLRSVRRLVLSDRHHEAAVHDDSAALASMFGTTPQPRGA